MIRLLALAALALAAWAWWARTEPGRDDHSDF